MHSVQYLCLCLMICKFISSSEVLHYPGGTTSLSILMKYHPEICGASIKETHFFDADGNWNKGLQFYRSMFSKCREGLKTFDATPVFHNDVVSTRIKQSIPPERLKQLRFVLILREPVAREFSLYEHRMRFCEEYLRLGKDFDQSVDFARGSCIALIPGFNENTKVFAPRTFREYFELQHLQVQDSDYALHLSRWLQVISRDQLLILSMQTLLHDTTDTMRRLSLFFGLKKGWGANVTLPHDNDSSHMGALLDCDTYDDLRKYYDKTIGNLQQYLKMGNRPKMEPEFPPFEKTREKCVDVKRHVKTPAITHQINKPDFFIFGPQQSGTTILHDLMVKNPQICGRGEEQKNFFNHDDAWEKGLDEYVRRFSMCPNNQYSIDSSPMLRFASVPSRLQIAYAPSNLRKKKFFLILREPVAREFSWFEYQVAECLKLIKGEHVQNKVLAEHSCHRVMPKFEGNNNKNLKPLSFREYYTRGRINLQGSYYKFHLDNWLKAVHRDQIFIVTMRTLLVNTTDTMRRIKNFLGLQQGWGEDVKPPRDDGGAAVLNSSGGSNGSNGSNGFDNSNSAVRPLGGQLQLDCWTFDELGKHYAAKNKELEGVVNHKDRPKEQPDFSGFDTNQRNCVHCGPNCV